MGGEQRVAVCWFVTIHPVHSLLHRGPRLSALSPLLTALAPASQTSPPCGTSSHLTHRSRSIPRPCSPPH